MCFTGGQRERYGEGDGVGTYLRSRKIEPYTPDLTRSEHDVDSRRLWCDISGGSDGGNEVDGGISSDQIASELKMFCVLKRESEAETISWLQILDQVAIDGGYGSIFIRSCQIRVSVGCDSDERRSWLSPLAGARKSGGENGRSKDESRRSGYENRRSEDESHLEPTGACGSDGGGSSVVGGGDGTSAVGGGDSRGWWLVATDGNVYVFFKFEMREKIEFV
ncbi:unnamed protein product [Lactuca virosa]|uniref:PH domain-containing protein n=1 Tax=Lactuca virosa TaxID=75947 RepID=A0AAU9PGL0_9ASTR|nr:unnamed protein product [Lactuca virosa]